MNLKNNHEHVWYIAPAFIVLICITIFPTIFLYIISLTNYDLAQKPGALSFVGLKNYWYLFTVDKDFWKSVGITMIFTVVSVGVELILGLMIAFLLDGNRHFRRLKSSLIIIPMVVTPAIIALIWKLMLNTEYGILNTIIKGIGLNPVNWLGIDNALISLILIDIWQWTPYVVLMAYSGLQTVPTEPLEAAAVDGATWFQRARFIILPYIRPILAITILLKTIECLKSFDIVYGLTQGGPANATEVMSLHIFRLGFKQTHWVGRASANAVLLLLITIPIITILSKSIKYSRDI